MEPDDEPTEDLHDALWKAGRLRAVMLDLRHAARWLAITADSAQPGSLELASAGQHP